MENDVEISTEGPIPHGRGLRTLTSLTKVLITIMKVGARRCPRPVWRELIMSSLLRP